jgi:hypothetical protein
MFCGTLRVPQNWQNLAASWTRCQAKQWHVICNISFRLLRIAARLGLVRCGFQAVRIIGLGLQASTSILTLKERARGVKITAFLCFIDLQGSKTGVSRSGYCALTEDLSRSFWHDYSVQF